MKHNSWLAWLRLPPNKEARLCRAFGYICPPSRGTKTRGLAVIGIEPTLLANRGHEMRFQLIIGKVGDAALPRNVGILLDYGAFGREERAKGIKAQQQIPLGHGGDQKVAFDEWFNGGNLDWHFLIADAATGRSDVAERDY